MILPVFGEQCYDIIMLLPMHTQKGGSVTDELHNDMATKPFFQWKYRTPEDGWILIQEKKIPQIYALLQKGCFQV